jgi:hypothetical protein
MSLCMCRDACVYTYVCICFYLLMKMNAPDSFDSAKVRTVFKIESERGMYMYMYMYIYRYTCIYMYTHIYTCKVRTVFKIESERGMYMYIYRYTCIYMYTYIYIYIKSEPYLKSS